MPVLILLFFKYLNPVIWNTHGHAIIESDAATLYRISKSGHSAHLFSNSDGTTVYLMDKFVGKGKIYNRIGVLVAVVIVGIRAKSLAETVVIIQHRGYSIEAETIEAELLKPIFAIGEQEVEHLIFAIIET